MGNVVTNVSRFAIRKARRFNVENRTHRFLDKNIKVVPPRHESTGKQIEQLNEAYPGMVDKLAEKNVTLHDRLKDVYVSSYDLPLDKRKFESANRPLPSLRNVGFYPEYGYVEPEGNTPGRISLKKAFEMINKYQTEKKSVSYESLAVDYNLKVKDVENIISYYRVFLLQKSSELQETMEPEHVGVLESYTYFEAIESNQKQEDEKKREKELIESKKQDEDVNKGTQQKIETEGINTDKLNIKVASKK